MERSTRAAIRSGKDAFGGVLAGHPGASPEERLMLKYGPLFSVETLAIYQILADVP
jgi:hypothetical protein